MATATVHIAEVGGCAGPARCYRLDPPARLNGAEYDYVTIWVQPAYAHQNAEVVVVPADETGASAIRSLRPQGGSVTLHDDYTPGDTVYEDGVRWLALRMLGDYQVVTP